MAGRMSLMATEQRDHVETALAVLASAVLAIDEALLRNRQAIRRSNQVGDVLGPAVQRLVDVQADLKLMQAELRAAWKKGQAERWTTDDERRTT